MFPLPLEGFFTYSSKYKINTGSRVIVQLKNKPYPAIVVKEGENPVSVTKEILEILDNNEPFFSQNYINLITKLSEEYCCSPGSILDAIMPANLLKTPFELFKGEPDNSPHQANFHIDENAAKISRDISQEIANKQLKFLLFDKTGSQKYSIFLDLICKTLKDGKQVKIITSDVRNALKIETLLRKALNITVEVYHSRRSLSIRRKVISLFRSGQISVLVGAKSALLLPAKNIGLIIVENEHDELYKQEESPHLQFRKVAEIYAEVFRIPILLSSLMPSVESYYKAIKDEYIMHKIEKDTSEKASVNIIDMRKTEKISNILSIPLYEELFNTIKNNKKALILINKKGFSKYLICSNCGTILQCDRCSVALTYYKTKKYCRCNYCGKIYKIIICGKCSTENFIDYGEGIDQVYETIKTLLNCRIIKLDADLLDKKEERQNVIKIIDEGHFDIIIATNIIFRRFDNLNVQIIFLPAFENIINFPDFRLYERVTRQMLILTGIIDTFSKATKFYIQTYDPDNLLFGFFEKNIEYFYDYELSKRQKHLYPPFGYIARFILMSKNYNILPALSKQLIDTVSDMKDIIILGPSNALIIKVRNNFRYHFIIKSNMKEVFYDGCKKIRNKFQEIKKSDLKLIIDIDPYTFI
jgi:primosomal protein N' (replication factor Y)